VVGQAVDDLRPQRHVRVEPLDDRSAVVIEDALPDDAHRAKAHLLLAGVGAEDAAHDALQLLALRADDLGHEAVERLGGLDHLARHEAAVGRLQPRVEDAPQELLHGDAQALLRVGRHLGRHQRVLLAGLLAGVAQDLAVQAGLVAEVVVDGGHVGVRALADLAHRRGAVALLGEGLEACSQEPLAGAGGRDVVVGDGGAHGFEHPFDSYILNCRFKPSSHLFRAAAAPPPG